MRYLIFLLFLLPLITFAQTFGNSGQNTTVGNQGQTTVGNQGQITVGNNNGGQVTTTGSNRVVQIENPLAAESITDFFIDLIQILLIFAVPIIVFFIILAGFRFVTAQGNESKLAEAKNALLFAIIGGMIILGAYVILEVIQGTVGSFLANP